MDRLTCEQCGSPIPNGRALIRSRSLEQVTFHPTCYHPTPSSVPEQRQPESELARAS